VVGRALSDAMGQADNDPSGNNLALQGAAA